MNDSLFEFTNLFVIYDTETTGLDVSTDHIISLGAKLCTFNINLNCFEDLSEFHEFIQTDKKINPEAESVHHISREILDSKGKPFLQVLELFKSWIFSYSEKVKKPRIIFVAHNGRKFDNLILLTNFVHHKQNFEKFLKDLKCFGFIDSLIYMKKLFGQLPNNEKPQNEFKMPSFALGNCYKSFCGGKELENAHDALVDCKALYAVLNSNNVKKLNNFNKMCQHITRTLDEVNILKQAANLNHQSDMDISEDSNEDHKLNDDDKKEFHVNIPFFAPENHNTLKKQLCHNCISFVFMEEHLECFRENPTNNDPMLVD